MDSTAFLHPAEAMAHYGKCLELIPMDRHFHDISIGLYEKAGLCTVWTFSRKPGATDRIRYIRDQLVELGGLVPEPGTHHQFRSPCGELHPKPLRFLLVRAVDKPTFQASSAEMRIGDTKSNLELVITGHQAEEAYHYTVDAEGEAPNKPMRLRMVVSGFLRYGQLVKVGETVVAFGCGQRHDGLMRILLPSSRNISAVETMLEAEAMRGQMTTSTLGFSQT